MTVRKILITGSDGLLGWHTRAFFSVREDTEVSVVNRATFNSDQLASLCANTDVIIHLAGVNRGSDAEVATNVDIADRLVQACEETGSTPHILFSNSTHADRDTVYGRSKKEAANRIQNWADDSEGRFSNIVLPHIFGEHGRPFYNSVVSTFCHQVAIGETPEIQQDGILNLLHAQDAAQLFEHLIESKHSGEIRPDGRELKVSELLSHLERLRDRYNTDRVVPSVDEPFQLRLFNTFRSYISHNQRPVALELWSDERGSLFEAIRSDGLGQFFVSTTFPGITRGEHFHFRKVERFLVVSGSAKIRLRRIFDDQVHEFDVSGDNLQAIDIPTLHTHNITNTGDTPLLTLFWSSEHFDRNDPDTYAAKVQSDDSTKTPE
ncbi:MAG: NAD-dependent epimerase/dehydratase family protein [Fuerstiella sp.]